VRQKDRAMTETTSVDLPYFDQILDHFVRSPHSQLAKAMRRHVHWGFFSSPTADFSVDSCIAAAETMTERICQAGRVGNGMRILDVGCGFGGTIAHLNEQLSGCELVGLNIDERQLGRARQSVTARSGNTVRFVQGDACALPFKDGSFDVVLAVECIFHFPSRRTFFSEARRVLRDKGTLALSDFVVDAEKIDAMAEWTEANGTNSFYGVKSAALCTGTYARVARSTGFTVLRDEDITPNTMPTYPGLKGMFTEVNMAEGVSATAYLEELSRRGFFQYRILSFETKSA
jgi:ubiquinone/menaquinone biosynthesis C-methylase UbiE